MKISRITLLLLYFAPYAFAQFSDVTSSYIHPITLENKSENHYFIDFGKAAFGTLNLRFDSAPGDSLIVHLGEKLNAEGSIDTNPGGSIRYKRIVLIDPPVGKTFLLPL